MANEILYAGLADQRLTETLAGLYLQMIGDRNALPEHPALIYIGDFAKSGSTSRKVPHVGLNAYDLPAAIAELASTPNTALTDSSTTLAMTTFSKAYEVGDVARATDPLAVLNADKFAMDAVISGAMRKTNLIANVADDFTTTVGTSGADLTIAQFVSGVNSLEINVQAEIGDGDALSVLHPVQVGDLRTNALSIGGAAQWREDMSDLIPIRGSGYRGRLAGVDLFSSPQVPTANAGADRAGSIFVRGAILWGDMTFDNENDANTLNLGKVMLERKREARTRSWVWLMALALAVSKGIDLCGVGVTTDA